MDSKLSRIVLRAKIRGLSQAALKSRTLINSTSGKARDTHWCTKRAIGMECRWHILASAFIRGIPHRDVEKQTNSVSNPVMVDRVSQIAWEHGYFYSRETALEGVKAWLAIPARKQPENLLIGPTTVTAPKSQGFVQKAVQAVRELLS